MKMNAVTGAIVVSVLALALVTGCSRERIDWKSAESADTLEAYDHFVERHPDSALATQAHARMTQLVEDKDWQHASGVDTADAYKAFLAQHASGKWAEEARIRVENFTLETNPSPLATPSGDTEGNAPSAGAGASSRMQPGEAATRAPPASVAATEPPTPVHVNATNPTSGAAAAAKPANAAPSAPAAASTRPAAGESPPAGGSADFGIQLGAFSTQASALGAWKRLQVTHDSELHGLQGHAVPVKVPAGQLFRLQAPVGEENRARGICAALVKRSQPCVVVLPQVK